MESGGQAEQAVGGAEQALAEQHRQCREDAAVGDRGGWLGEHRRGLGQQAGAGEHAALDGARRAAHGRVLVAGVAGGAVGGRRRHYESLYGGMAREIPSPSMSAYGSETPYQREWVGGVENPELAASQAAFFAATTIDEQMKAAEEFGMALMTQHNNMWLPMAPMYQASHPWVGGFNGETRLGNSKFHTILARLWIDQDLKREMGF